LGRQWRSWRKGRTSRESRAAAKSLARALRPDRDGPWSGGFSPNGFHLTLDRWVIGMYNGWQGTRDIVSPNQDGVEEGRMPVPTAVKVLENYRLWVRFSDGVEGIVDLSEFAGKGIFALWNDYREFERAHVGPDGEIAWNDQIDMCPDAIYLKITGKKAEELFPGLQALVQHA
jgi:hypothetical protein